MLQIIGVALIGGILAVYLRTINGELAMLAVIGTGILLLFMTLGYLSESVEMFKKLADMSKVDNALLNLIIKIVAIGYIVEFAAGLLEDFGLRSISTKLVFAGKLIILTVSLPVFYALINILVGLVA